MNTQREERRLKDRYQTISIKDLREIVDEYNGDDDVLFFKIIVKKPRSIREEASKRISDDA